MTWETLERLLSTIEGAPTLARDQPASTLDTLERLADRRPTDRRIAAAIRALHDALLAERGLDLEIGGVRRTELVAWRSWDATWLGVDLASGSPAFLRTCRHGSDPVHKRSIDRDATALAGLVDSLRSGPGWVAALAPGVPLVERGQMTGEHLAVLAGSAIARLGRFERSGQWPVLSDSQWRLVDGRVVPVALDTRHPADAGETLSWLARRLGATNDPTNPIEEALMGIATAPPRTAALAAEVLEHAMATDLAARRHGLFAQRRATAHDDRAARLLEAIRRLQDSLGPPLGRGAVGVDMEGRVTAVVSEDGEVKWGPLDELEPLWIRGTGFAAPVARRLLRARASAAPSSRLHREVGGKPQTAEHIGRWVAAGLKVRTIRLLLEKELAARA